MDDYSIASEFTIEEAERHQQLKTVEKINTAFGYFGSKNNIALKLCQHLPPHNCWVEAFCGSAALTLVKRKAPIEVINDIDGEIVNLFQQLRDNANELCRLVSLTPYSKKELDDSRVADITDSSLEKARKFLVQAMMAINGVFGKEKGGFSYSQSYSRNCRDARVNRWYNLPHRITKVVERLRDVRIDNRNAIDIIAMFANRPATLLYLDPPYLADRTKGYTHEASEESFHESLLAAAMKSRSMIFISGYENDLYNSLLTAKNGWGKRTIETFTRGVQGNGLTRSEVVWTNKYFQKAIANNKIPIRLTAKEKRENKVNPKRK